MEICITELLSVKTIEVLSFWVQSFMLNATQQQSC